jgi:hypothetical protein
VLFDREKTLLYWTRTLVAFANGEEDRPKDSIERAHYLRVQEWLGLLARAKARNRRHLHTEAVRWLKSVPVDLLLRAPVTIALSFDKKTRPQMKVKGFSNKMTGHAISFAELLRRDAPALVLRCQFDECKRLFAELPRRGRQFKFCDEHRWDSAINRTHRVHLHKFRRQVPFFKLRLLLKRLKSSEGTPSEERAFRGLAEFCKAHAPQKRQQQPKRKHK